MKNIRTLMIIDDDRDDIYFFLKAVKKLPEEFDCIAAENGVKALEKLNSENELPDFIFLDLNMPCMDGLSCINELKKSNKFKHIPVIIYSTSSSGSEKQALKNSGAAYYLSKPLDVMMLPGLIQEAIEAAETQVAT
ncbi:MAG: response regulator [Bacteroidia bacterium]